MMRRVLRVFLALCAVLLASPTTAQQDAPSGGGRFWVAELPGGSYMVNLGSIAATGKHTFVVPGGGRVHEVTVDTVGSVTARFYFVDELPVQSPLGIGQSVLDQARQRVEEIKDRVSPAAGGLVPWQQVVKNYPDATHAHTIEFRVGSQKVIDDLYKHLTDAMERGRGGKFKAE